jgi:hypothetical protein
LAISILIWLYFEEYFDFVVENEVAVVVAAAAVVAAVVVVAAVAAEEAFVEAVSFEAFEADVVLAVV